MEKYLNKITLGDCYKLIKELPNQSIDCVYTDIPYLYEHGGGGSSAVAKRINKQHNETLIEIRDGIDNQRKDRKMNIDKQIEEKLKITKIYEPIDIPNDEMRKLADEMGKAISNEYEKRVLADERKLEAVLKENGWRKASDVAEDIVRMLRAAGINEWRYPIVAEIKKKYLESEKDDER